MSQSTKESKLGPDQTLSRVSAAFPRVVYWLCMCPQLHLVSTHLIVKSNITSGGEACHEMTCENMVMSRKQINLNLSVGQLHVCAQRGHLSEEAAGVEDFMFATSQHLIFQIQPTHPYLCHRIALRHLLDEVKMSCIITGLRPVIPLWLVGWLVVACCLLA